MNKYFDQERFILVSSYLASCRLHTFALREESGAVANGDLRATENIKNLVEYARTQCDQDRSALELFDRMRVVS